MTYQVDVPLQCTWMHAATDSSDSFRCTSLHASDHVHRPTPCENGQDERHHAYAPPKSVTLRIGGQIRRIRFATNDGVTV